MIIEEDIYLEHYGVKGMRWGIRKKEDSGDAPDRDHQWSNKKKAAVILGSAAAVAAIAVGSVYAKKHLNVSMKDIHPPKESTKKFAQSMAERPASIVHATRGKHRGFVFLGDGKLKSPLAMLEDSGLGESSSRDTSFFRRFGPNSENAAVRFLDPQGRLDRSSRPIAHEVILPAYLSRGVNNHEQAVERAWPFIRDMYEAFYDS